MRSSQWSSPINSQGQSYIKQIIQRISMLGCCRKKGKKKLGRKVSLVTLRRMLGDEYSYEPDWHLNSFNQLILERELKCVYCNGTTLYVENDGAVTYRKMKDELCACNELLNKDNFHKCLKCNLQFFDKISKNLTYQCPLCYQEQCSLCNQPTQSFPPSTIRCVCYRQGHLKSTLYLIVIAITYFLYVCVIISLSNYKRCFRQVVIFFHQKIPNQRVRLFLTLTAAPVAALIIHLLTFVVAAGLKTRAQLRAFNSSQGNV